MSPGKRALAGEKIKVQAGCVDRSRDSGYPDAFPFRCVGKRELEHKANPPEERLVEILAPIGGENRDAAKSFHALEQVAHFHVGKAVVGVTRLDALAEERFRFIEEEQGIGP